MDQQHLLQKYIWEIEFNSSEEKAFEFQTRISTYIKESLVKLTEEVFTEFSDKKYDIKINKLELDLGEIDLNDLEHELYWKLKKKLEDELELRLIKSFVPEDESKPEFISKEESKLRVFSHFLQYGYFPWAVKKIEGSVSVRQLFRELITEEPARVKKLLDTCLKSDEIRLRLIRQLEDTDLWLIVKIWAESELELYRKVFSDVVKLFLTKPVIKKTFTEYRELVWKFYLEEVIVKNNSLKNTRAVMDSMIAYISKVTYIPEEEVVAAYLITVVENTSILSFQSVLPKVITEIAAEKHVPVYRLDVQRKKQLIDELNKTSTQKVKELIQNTLPHYHSLISEFIREAIAIVKKLGMDIKEKEVDTNIWKAAIEFLSQNDVRVFSKNDFISYLIIQFVKNQSVSSFSFIQNLNLTESEKQVLIHKVSENIEVVSEEGEKGFEEFRRSEQIRKEKYLTDVLLYAVWIKEVEQLALLIPGTENIIKELFITNPVLLKRLFTSSGFDLNKLPYHRFIENLSPAVAEKVLSEIAGIDEGQRIALKESIQRSIVIQLLETGNIPYLELSKIDKKSLDAIILSFDKSHHHEFTHLIEKYLFLPNDSTDVPSIKALKAKVATIKSQLSGKVFSRFFSSLENKHQTLKVEDLVIKSADVKSADDFISLIRRIINDKFFKEQIESDIGDLVNDFVNDYPQQSRLFFLKISEKEFMKLKTQLKPITFESIERDRRRILNDIEPVVQKAKSTSEDHFMVEEKQEYVKLNTGEPIYINNAGLVIFHPYLTRFFKMLNLVDKKDFKDEYSAHKAVHILQYLANKGLQSEEHELVLNKVLCGIDINTPIFRDIDLTDEDKSTCESLIEGVIQNWPILKNTSTDNLRGSFIMREGRLTADPKGWLLKVEERGYDVLVEKLPWAIGMVKLSWMNKIVYVEWK